MKPNVILKETFGYLHSFSSNSELITTDQDTLLQVLVTNLHPSNSLTINDALLPISDLNIFCLHSYPIVLAPYEESSLVFNLNSRTSRIAWIPRPGIASKSPSNSPRRPELRASNFMKIAVLSPQAMTKSNSRPNSPVNKPKDLRVMVASPVNKSKEKKDLRDFVGSPLNKSKDAKENRQRELRDKDLILNYSKLVMRAGWGSVTSAIEVPVRWSIKPLPDYSSSFIYNSNCTLHKEAVFKCTFWNDSNKNVDWRLEIAGIGFYCREPTLNIGAVKMGSFYQTSLKIVPIIVGPIDLDLVLTDRISGYSFILENAPVIISEST